ncbi:potassium/proton antiporter [Chrysiogenes arsenatis]|uniref:potassium/proton antiporter n=1 Tax=Chrysiogenes arsenatis TaxID=309797 RepID=UPI00041F2399|nr:potassium/proton antiporter [Chrysiogenes arsenatis]
MLEILFSTGIPEIFHTNYYLVLFALLAIISVIATRFATRYGVPALVLFIGFGMIAGSDGLKLINFSDPFLAQLFGTVALVIILFDGGMQTKWDAVRKVMAPALSLATVGVVVTAGIVGIAAKLILPIGWLEALLLGSIVGSTDAAAVFSVLSGKNIQENLARTLEAESGTNDPMAVFLTLGFIQLILSEKAELLSLIPQFFWQMGVGGIAGYAFGRFAVWVLNRIRLDSGGLYPVLGLGFAFFVFSASALINASGFLAVYILALVIGNSDVPYRHAIFRFNEGLAWMMQILMFIMLGLMVAPQEMFEEFLVVGLLLSVVLTLVARPIGVYISLIPFHFNFKEFTFLSWSGLKGAVPIILATYPMLAGVEHSQSFFNVVFFIVLTSTLVQGATISPLAKWLGFESPGKKQQKHTIELLSLGTANADIIEYIVNEDDDIVGKQIRDLLLPKGTLINAIIREDNITTPTGHTVIQSNDLLFILVPKENIARLKRVLTKHRKDVVADAERGYCELPDHPEEKTPPKKRRNRFFRRKHNPKEDA